MDRTIVKYLRFRIEYFISLYLYLHYNTTSLNDNFTKVALVPLFCLAQSSD